MALLNLDAGERDDESEDLWDLFDIVNIACGGHAGDDASMERVIAFCARAGRPAIGAHPSYPDRAGFGRRSIPIQPPALRAAVAGQCAALRAVADRHAMTIGWVKPHGALYRDAATTPALARAVLEGAVDALGSAIAVIGPHTGALRDAATALELRYAREGFADRQTRPDGSLVPRSEPGALITEPGDAAARARALASTVDTICVHADTPNARAIARAVRAALRT